MAIYTKVGAPQLNEFLADYDVGELKTHEGVVDGIVNTTYRVDTEHDGQTRRFILTLFEHWDFNDLPYFIEVMCHLSETKLPCAQPIADKRGVHLKTLRRQPTVLATCLPGATMVDVNDEQRRQVGAHLAAMHKALADFGFHRGDDRGLDWCAAQAAELMPLLDADNEALLRSELRHQTECDLHAAHELPRGVIHTDLFRDNVLFEGDTLTGLIDFYSACDGALVYDLAVTVNDWCRNADHTLNAERARLVIDAYAAERKLQPSEIRLFNDALRLAALRFWVSRLTDANFPGKAGTVRAKDPEVFRRLLEHHRASPPLL